MSYAKATMSYATPKTLGIHMYVIFTVITYIIFFQPQKGNGEQFLKFKSKKLATEPPQHMNTGVIHSKASFNG